MKEIYINRTVRLEKGDDGFYRDETGVIYALPDKNSSVDDVTRCGVGMLSLPENMSINDVCRMHDFAYSSPVFQFFHTRKEADEMLRHHAAMLGYPILGKVFKSISRIFGKKYWENKKTND